MKLEEILHDPGSLVLACLVILLQDRHFKALVKKLCCLIGLPGLKGINKFGGNCLRFGQKNKKPPSLFKKGWERELQRAGPASSAGSSRPLFWARP